MNRVISMVQKGGEWVMDNAPALTGGAATLMVSGLASAALPTEATAAFTTLSSNVTDILAAIWPILAAVVGGFTLIKLFKKGASKAV